MKKMLIGLVFIALSLVLVNTANAQGIIDDMEMNTGWGGCGMTDGGSHMLGFGGMYGFSFIGLLVWLVIIGLIIWLIYVLVQKPKNPLQILKQKYAEGKITKKDYEKMKKNLMED